MANNQNNSQKSDREVTFDIRDKLGVIGVNTNREKPWTKEVNIVSWNGGKAKIDVREWNPEHDRMSKGVTLFDDEAKELVRVLTDWFGMDDAAPTLPQAAPAPMAESGSQIAASA